MSENRNITAITATLCRLMGIPFPSIASGPLEEVLVCAASRLPEGICRKMLVFCPDAIGSFLFDRYPDSFAEIQQAAPVKIKLQSVYPSSTPVCFASMFTGLQPEQHGIRKYEKPVLQCTTLFDILAEHDKKAAIVTVRDSSIDKIFRNRPIDYYSMAYDEEVTEKTIELLLENEHDFILAYNQAYDDRLHETSPESKPALDAFRKNLRNFLQISHVFNQAWKQYPRGILFAPDHGAHYDSATKTGVHGTDLPEDMRINHFFGFYKSE